MNGTNHELYEMMGFDLGCESGRITGGDMLKRQTKKGMAAFGVLEPKGLRHCSELSVLSLDRIIS